MEPHGFLPDFCATREGFRAGKTVLRPFPREVSEKQDAAFSYQKLIPSSTGAKFEVRSVRPV